MSINRTILIGRLVKDPDLRKTPNGTSVASFTLAVDNRASGNGEKSTSFFQVVAWSNTADFVGQYVKKGYRVGVDGRLQQRSYENNSGQKIQVVEVIADQVQNYQPQEEQFASGQTQATAPVQEPGPNDDDLPF